MEKEAFILEGAKYHLSFTGEKDRHSWTEIKGNDHDGEYERTEWEFKWKGLLELLCKETNKLFQIHFKTFTVERYYSSHYPDHSLEGLALHCIKKTKRDFDRILLADFIGEDVLKLINRRKAEKDEGLLGITAVFTQDLCDEQTLLSKGILTDEGNQMRIAVAM